MEVALLTLLLLTGPSVRTSAFVCSADGQHVAVIDTRHELTLFRREDWSVVAELGPVRSEMLQAAPDGFLVFQDAGLVRFSFSGDVLERRPWVGYPPLRHFWFRLSPSGSFVATRGESGAATVWDGSLDERLGMVEGIGPHRLVWSEDERWLLVGGWLSQPFVEGEEVHVVGPGWGLDDVAVLGGGGIALLSSQEDGSTLTLWTELHWPPDVRWSQSFPEGFGYLAAVDGALVLGTPEGDLRVLSSDGAVLGDRAGTTDGAPLWHLAPCGPGTVLSLDGARGLRAWSVEDLVHRREGTGSSLSTGCNHPYSLNIEHHRGLP